MSTTTSSSSGSIPIKHIFIIMEENHTFDNYFGTYPGANGISGATPQPIAPNSTQLVSPFMLNKSTVWANPCETWVCAHKAYDGGKMDGFVVANKGSNLTMGYYNPELIADYWDYASRYVLLDNLFTSAMTNSLANHMYLLAGTSGGLVNDSFSAVFNFPTIVQELDAANVSWVYYAGFHSALNGWNPLPGDIPYTRAHPNLQGIKESTDFPADVAKPNFPSVAWIMPETDQISEHAPANVTAGMLRVVSEVNDIMKSQYWSSSMILVTWDDWGGWYDHVSPPQVDQYGYGFRVPGLIISPYAKTGYIDNTLLSFSSTLKFIETVFNLPSLGTRDVEANDILQAFNFSQAPEAPLVLPLNSSSPSPFVPNHYPLTYLNGTVYRAPSPRSPPSSKSPPPSRSPSILYLEYGAIAISAAVVLVVAVLRISRRKSPGAPPPSSTPSLSGP
jgi:phospholipase C